MKSELDLIKKKYGEEMTHLCRELFPIILEDNKILYNLLIKNFDENKNLYHDIVEEEKILEFKDYIYSLVDVEKGMSQSDETPKDLFEKAGYDLYECKTEEEMNQFLKYYKEDEALCSFKMNRIENYYVFFALKNNIDQIQRENFNIPNRQDEYGTSILCLKFMKGKNNTLSISNRYNHRVTNPDATFSNNLDNIIPGLTTSFIKNYNFNFNLGVDDFYLPYYIKTNEDKYYKYNLECNNTYFGVNNTIIDHSDIYDYKTGKINDEKEEVIHLDKEKFILIENYIVDIVNKTVYPYSKEFMKNNILTNTYSKEEVIKRQPNDSFTETIKKVSKIEIENIKNEENQKIGRNIIFKLDNAQEDVTLSINNENKITKYINNNIFEIGDEFLKENDTLEYIELNNVIKIGDEAFNNNENLKDIKLPNTEIIGDDFLMKNTDLSNINLPKIKIIGKGFMKSNNNLNEIDLSPVERIGKGFMLWNNSLNKLYVNEFTSISKDCLANNKNINIIKNKGKSL